MYRRCDNCDNKVHDRGAGLSDERLRVLGWHIWDGTTIGGELTHVQLCGACCGSTRPARPEVLEGQGELF